MKLDYKRTFILGFGFFGISIVWSVYNSFVPVFLRDYQLSWWLVGFVMTIDNILGILLLPYIGQMSDNTRTRFGRRLPFIMLGAPVAALFLVGIPLAHLNISQSALAFGLMTVCIVIMNLSMALFRTPTVALMPDITPSALRSKANGIINLMGGVGTSIAFLAGGMLFSQGKALPFILAAVVMLIAEVIVVARIKEPSDDLALQDAKPVRPNLGATLRDTLGNVGSIVRAKDKSALFVCLAIFCWFMGYNAIEAFWTSYGRDVIYASQIAAGTLSADAAVGKSASMLTYLSAAFLVFALPSGLIATRFGRKPTILVGLGLLIVLWAGMGIIHAEAFVLPALVLSGIAWALININSLPVVADLAPAGKLGSYTGLYYFFSMFAASTSPTIMGGLIDVVGLDSLFVFTPIWMALAFICMLQVRRSEPEDFTVEKALEMVADADF